MKTNFNLAKELAEQSPNDWKFGYRSEPSLVSIPLSERETYLPQGEDQFDQFADFTDCASRSPVNHLEALFTYHYQHAMLQANKDWLLSKGYVKDNRVTFSDRYIAKLSGTTHDGNSLKSPIDTIRTKGLVPKSLLPKTDTMTWDEYYQDIPQNLLDLGGEFLKRFSINYEQVYPEHFNEVIKDDMLGVAGFAWPQPINGVYPQNDGSFNHAFLYYSSPAYQIFDNYEESPGDFTKTLAPDYKLLPYGYRVYISAENIPQPTLLEMFWKWFLSLNPTSMPPQPHLSRITPWALAIQHAEGGKPQDLNTRNHNPGNLKYSSYTAALGGKQGSAGKDGGHFCYFDTYDQGFKALCTFLTDAANDQLLIGHGLTLDEFTTRYAQPPSKMYVRSVAEALDVPITIKIKELL